MPKHAARRAQLGAAVTGEDARADADRLCHVCADLLEVDGASISVLHEGTTAGTFGSTEKRNEWLDELQFTFGEGPSVDAVANGTPVLVPDLGGQWERRWPAFTEAVLAGGIGAVFAFPVTLASSCVGSLNLFRSAAGPLADDAFISALLTAELAALPLLNLMSSDLNWDAASRDGGGWEHLASLDRVEVYQATGMLIAALAIRPTDALVRLRAYAFTNGMTAAEVALAVLDRRLPLDAATWHPEPSDASEADR